MWVKMGFRAYIFAVVCVACLVRTTVGVTCGTVECDGTNGVCTDNICWCNIGTGGVGCVDTCTGTCTGALCVGPLEGDCKVDTACPTAACALTGTCAAYDEGTPNIGCQCDATYVGTACDQVCPLTCNSGTCVADPAGTVGVCDCPATDVGDTCEQACPADCNTGTCVADPAGTAGVCDCPATHVGDACEQACPADCNTGTCVAAPSGTDGVCDCPATHVGDTCEQDCPTDPACVEYYEECLAGTPTTCDCLVGLSGDDCKTITCTAGDPCYNGGTCAIDTCTCNTTMYAGDLCQLTCTAVCTEGKTCQEEAGVGTCLGSGGSCLIASVILVLAVAARHLL